MLSNALTKNSSVKKHLILTLARGVSAQAARPMSSSAISSRLVSDVSVSAQTSTTAVTQDVSASFVTTTRGLTASTASRTGVSSSAAPTVQQSREMSVSTAAKTGHFEWKSDIHRTNCGLYVDRALPQTFNKILIANRGEIACRVIRTCKQLGIKTVAVYSDADANALFVKMADEAYNIGPAASAQSYLRGDYLIELAKKVGAEAIHPGYGFLSENAGFAEACFKAGVEFIGPPVPAITAMGSKSASKNIMNAAGVRCVPGYHGTDQSNERLFKEAEKTGYPIMLKAVSGGGGKGMRIVWKPEEFEEALEGCRREAMASFKDDNVLLERYIQNPRHIEFQVFADKQGNAVHLYERDCSVQRRHQKVFEEAPAPGMSPELRAKMGKSATDAAKAVGYVGAGTVEFIFDADTDEYFFMEMNTRLQVEHCVSEMVVHKDLVQWQLHVAAGYPLPVTDQSKIVSHGHALELRVYAENPHNNFFPATGHLTHLRAPPLASDVRVETGVRQGDEVSIHYDPMISKLVTWGPDRASCLKRMLTALEEYEIVGPPTNIDFAQRVLVHPAFVNGKVTTKFIASHVKELVPPVSAPPNEAVALAVLQLLFKESAASVSTSAAATSHIIAAGGKASVNPWSTTTTFRVNDDAPKRTVKLLVGGQAIKQGDKQQEITAVVSFPKDVKSLQLTRPKDIVAEISINGGAPVLVTGEVLEDGRVICRYGKNMVLGNVVVTPPSHVAGSEIHVFALQGKHFAFNLPLKAFGASLHAGSGARAPMAGKIVKVNVKAGDTVKQGQPLVVMEAMKMEHVLRASEAGVVKAVLFGTGDFVEGGRDVVVFEGEKDD